MPKIAGLAVIYTLHGRDCHACDSTLPCPQSTGTQQPARHVLRLSVMLAQNASKVKGHPPTAILFKIPPKLQIDPPNV
ncbi:hypothetical protein NW760_014722 [Fusarium oxysporum]|nr:hypothetical protein NW760_014722 [Fusarium oxysporum]